jgi:hypothetical protein
MEEGKLTEEERVKDVARRFVKTLGLLHYFMAKEVVDTFGQKGEEVVKRALRKYGTARGNAIRKVVESKGEELSIENLGKNYDIPLGLIHERKVIKLSEKNKLWREVYGCPLAKAVSELGGEKVGLFYCEQDEALVKGYNPEIKFDRKRNVLEGEECCETIWELV